VRVWPEELDLSLPKVPNSFQPLQLVGNIRGDGSASQEDQRIIEPAFFRHGAPCRSWLCPRAEADLRKVPVREYLLQIVP